MTHPASCKAVLLVLLVLLVAGRAAEMSETQEDARQMEKRKHGQNQTDMMILLKSLQARVEQLEAKRIVLLRGRDGRDGMPGLPGKCMTCKNGKNGKNGRPGPRGAPGVRGRPGRNGQRGPQGPRGYRGPGGVVYVRWGRTTCPSGASLVYKGRVGGTYYTQTGGGSNYVCLTENPRYGSYKNGLQNVGLMYGGGYELSTVNPLTKKNLQHQVPPCAICRVQTRSNKLMVPGTYACPAGWRREYWGYLMSEKHNHNHPTEYVCVDKDAEGVPGASAGQHGALLYPVEGVCGSLPCGPYVAGRELTCAVCTK